MEEVMSKMTTMDTIVKSMNKAFMAAERMDSVTLMNRKLGMNLANTIQDNMGITHVMRNSDLGRMTGKGLSDILNNFGGIELGLKNALNGSRSLADAAFGDYGKILDTTEYLRNITSMNQPLNQLRDLFNAKSGIEPYIRAGRTLSDLALRTMGTEGISNTHVYAENISYAQSENVEIRNQNAVALLSDIKGLLIQQSLNADKKDFRENLMFWMTVISTLAALIALFETFRNKNVANDPEPIETPENPMHLIFQKCLPAFNLDKEIDAFENDLENSSPSDALAQNSKIHVLGSSNGFIAVVQFRAMSVLPYGAYISKDDFESAVQRDL